MAERHINVEIADTEWTDAGDGTLFAEVRLSINGTPMHIEATAVRVDGHLQVGDVDDEWFSKVYEVARGDGHLQTTTIRDREYAIVIYPHC